MHLPVDFYVTCGYNNIIKIFLEGRNVLKMDFKLLWRVFFSFFKIGAFTFGGGYAMIPIIQAEAVEKHGWISDEDILEIVAIAESTPGPIAVNAATFVGYRTCGFLGAFCATLGVVLPGFMIILAISRLLREFSEIQAVRYAFYGVRAGILALILKALFSMYKKAPHGAVAYIVMAGAFIATAVFKINILIVVIACAIFGLITSSYAARRDKA